MAAAATPAPLTLFALGGSNAHDNRTFYATVFGWTQSGFLEEVPAGSGKVLVNCAAGGPAAMLGYIGVPDVDACLRTIEQNGGQSGPRPPIKDNTGVTTVAFFVDPGGNQMALTRWDPPSG